MRALVAVLVVVVVALVVVALVAASAERDLRATTAIRGTRADRPAVALLGSVLVASVLVAAAAASTAASAAAVAFGIRTAGHGSTKNGNVRVPLVAI